MGDRRERAGDLETVLLAAINSHQAGVWTALPGIIKSFDPGKLTVTVQPTIQARMRAPEGTFEWVTLPVLVDCPVVFPTGGGFTLTFPLKDGDECLVIFSSRCIDAWWQSGGVQPQAEMRMHDLSDGFCLPGPRSQARPLPSVSTTAVELRNDAGTALVRIKENGGIDVITPNNLTATVGGNMTATVEGSAVVTAASATVTAASITLNGNVTINGNLGVTGTLLNNGTNVGSTHVHNKNGNNTNTLGPQ